MMKAGNEKANLLVILAARNIDDFIITNTPIISDGPLCKECFDSQINAAFRIKLFTITPLFHAA